LLVGQVITQGDQLSDLASSAWRIVSLFISGEAGTLLPSDIEKGDSDEIPSNGEAASFSPLLDEHY
jgi:hypothetical protein